MSDGKGYYGNNENCVILTLQPLVATATEFYTESGYDYLTIDGTRYDGFYGPQELSLSQGTELVWSSDGSSTRSGFLVCAEEGSY